MLEKRTAIKMMIWTPITALLLAGMGFLIYPLYMHIRLNNLFIQSNAARAAVEEFIISQAIDPATLSAQNITEGFQQLNAEFGQNSEINILCDGKNNGTIKIIQNASF